MPAARPTKAHAPRDVAMAMKEMGIEPARITSDEVFALCPDHDDHTPNSWSVNRVTGEHYCFSCGFKGSFVTLVAKQLRLDGWEASKWIRSHGVELMDPADIPRYTEVATVREKKVRKAGEPLGESALALFTRPPWPIMELRELTQDSVDYYDVLWDLNKQGWILPIRDEKNVLLGWQFKSKRLFDNFPAAVPKSMCLFGLDTQQPTARTCILVESPLDCLRMHSAGVDPNEYCVLSSYGVEISDDQLRLIVQRFDRLILALDHDKAGAKATARILHGTVEFKGKREIKTDGWMSRIDTWVYNYGKSEGKDPGDQTDEEILWSVENCISGVKAGLTRAKVGTQSGVRGGSKALPGSRRRQGPRPQAGTRRVPNGARKDGRDDLRRRRTG